MTNLHLSERVTERYQLPVRRPLRLLLVASLSATVGTLEVIGWSVFGLPPFVLQAGTTLILVAILLGVRCHLRARSARWVLYVSDEGLSVARGSRRWELPWSRIGSARLVKSHLVILDRGGRRDHRILIDDGARHTAVLDKMLQAIDGRLMA